MEIAINKSERFTEVCIEGRLTLAATPEFKETMAGLTGENLPPALLLNLAGLEYIDSSGLGALMAVFTTARQRRLPLGIHSVPAKISEIFTITNLTSVLPLYDCRDEALQHLELAAAPW
jgi:anti-sigma B factor antagonist